MKRKVNHRIKTTLKKHKGNKLVLFVLSFAVIGTSAIVFTKAATPTASVEPENGNLAGNATIINNSDASGGKAVAFSMAIKPQIKGVVDRDAYDTSKSISKQNLLIPAEYEGIVNNFVLLLNWSQIQPNSSSDLDTSYIDDAVAEAKAKGMHIKLRILAGIHAPTWVKTIDGGPFDVYDIDNTTGEVFTGTSPKYWTDNYRIAYSGLMQKLAVKYDTEPTISSVANSMCTTIFAEPFIKNLDEGNNMTSFYNAGMTDTNDRACQNNSVDVHAQYWKYTRTETPINPLSYKGYDINGNPIEKFDVNFSIDWVNRCRQVLGARCIMGNNGFNAVTFSSNYRKVIGAIICTGNPPPYFQTRQSAAIISTGHTLAEVIQYAVDVGAGMVEMPVQYRTTAITPSELAPLDAALEVNSVIPCPADGLLPNPT